MSLRRFRIKKNEYEQVLAYIKKQKVDEKEDEKSPEPLADVGFRVPVDYLPKVVWAHKAPMKTEKIAHGRVVLTVREGDWKRVVHEGEIDGYLRESLLSKTADVPMSRDAGYHIVQKRTVGISRRAFAAFIRKQAVLQITRDALPEKKGVGRPAQARGNLEIDLVEAKGKDIAKFIHRPTKNFFWITLIDRLTGWLEVRRVLHKNFKTVVPAIRKMVGRMERALKTKVTYIRSDSGSEFQSKTKEMLASLGIRHRFVKSGNRLEQANKTYQKTWYRLLRLGRGDSLDDLDAQAVGIFNNTLSTINGRTPLEALETSDADLLSVIKERKKPKYKALPLKKGDKVRILIDSVRGKHGPELTYKSYRGKHWTADVHTVVKYGKERDAFYVASKWYTRDKLLKIPGVDAITRDKVLARHNAKKKGFAKDSGFEW